MRQDNGKITKKSSRFNNVWRHTVIRPAVVYVGSHPNCRFILFYSGKVKKSSGKLTDSIFECSVACCCRVNLGGNAKAIASCQLRWSSYCDGLQLVGWASRGNANANPTPPLLPLHCGCSVKSCG